MKLAIAVLLGFLIVAAVALPLQRNAYSLSLKIAEQRCNFLALASSDVDLTEDQIECSVVYDDIFLRLEISESAQHYVSCAQAGGLWFQQPPLACELYPMPID